MSKVENLIESKKLKITESHTLGSKRYLEDSISDLKSKENLVSSSVKEKSLDTDVMSSEIDGELDFEAEAGEVEEELELVEKYEAKDEDSDEDGQCTPEQEKAQESLEEGEDDGEVTDDNDYEEGEVIDNTPSSTQQIRQVCKFFVRGLCTWGNQCRFLHVNSHSKGNYNMFELTPRIPHFFPPPILPPPHLVPRMMRPPPPHMMGNFHPMRPPPLPRLPLLPPPREEAPPPVEPETGDDWDATLRETKALVRKASQKKDVPSQQQQHRKDYNKENNYKSNRKWGRYDNPYEKPYRNNGHEWEESNYKSTESYKERQERLQASSDKRDGSNSPHDYRRKRSGSYTSLSSLTFSDRSSRSRSYSGEHSSHSRSHSRSRSYSRTPSHSGSRSRSLSMDSVSSASSRDTSTSSSNKRKPDPISPNVMSLGAELKRSKAKVVKEEPLDPVDLPPLPPEDPPKPSLQLLHLLPEDQDETQKPSKPPLKFSFKKNKSKIIDIKSVLNEDKANGEEDQKGSKKRCASEERQTPPKASRRDELLKQLKAVEDAIARKRAK